jgi:hypothetical protein
MLKRKGEGEKKTIRVYRMKECSDDRYVLVKSGDNNNTQLNNSHTLNSKMTPGKQQNMGREEPNIWQQGPRSRLPLGF